MKDSRMFDSLPVVIMLSIAFILFSIWFGRVSNQLFKIESTLQTIEHQQATLIKLQMENRR